MRALRRLRRRGPGDAGAAEQSGGSGDRPRRRPADRRQQRPRGAPGLSAGHDHAGGRLRARVRSRSGLRRRGPATRARISIPFGVAVAPSGDVYVAELLLNDVRRISPSGTISRVAGTGRRCAHARRCGDGGAAMAAALNQPAAVAVDDAGRIYIADTEDHEVRVLDAPRSTPAGRRGTGRHPQRLGHGKRAAPPRGTDPRARRHRLRRAPTPPRASRAAARAGRPTPVCCAAPHPSPADASVDPRTFGQPSRSGQA